MKVNVILASFFLILGFSERGLAAEVADETGAGAQRAACDARCREDFQNNVPALQACLRECGAIGPASPGAAIAPGHEAAHTVQQATTVKGSKSNSSERQTGPAVPPPEPAEASNLNLSKSNINRTLDPGVQPAEATTVKSGKSNSSERPASPDSGEPVPGDG